MFGSVSLAPKIGPLELYLIGGGTLVIVLTPVPCGTPDGHSLGANVVAFADNDAKRPEAPYSRLGKGP